MIVEIVNEDIYVEKSGHVKYISFNNYVNVIPPKKNILTKDLIRYHDIVKKDKGIMSSDIITSEIGEFRNELYDKMKNHVIVPSFFKLFKYLDDKKIKYKLIFRTFAGEKDSNLFIKEFNKSVSCDRKIKKIINMDRKKYMKNYLYFMESKDDLSSIYIKDDFDYWKKNGKMPSGGKPFIIDEKNINIKQYFFDDNIVRDRNVKNIIDFYEIKDGKIVSGDMKNRYIVPVNILHMILNVDYFIDKIDIKNEM